MRKRSRRDALLLAALGLAACSRQPHLPGDEVDESAVVILEPWDTARYTAAAARVLSAALPQAERAPLARFDRVFETARQRRQVVVVPQLDTLPAEVWAPLAEFLDGGGCAVLWGERPFAERVWTAPGGMQRERDLVAALVPAAAPLAWPESQSWRLASEPPRPGLVLRVAADPALPWAGVQAEVTSSVAWAGLTAAFAPVPAPAASALLLFARGSERVPRLQFEIGDGSGTWWSASLAVGPQWAPQLLPRAAFLGPRAPPAWSEVAALRVGVPAQAADVPDAPYVFGLSDIRLVADPRPAWPVPPRWAGLPAERDTFQLPAARVALPDGAWRAAGGGAVRAWREAFPASLADADAARRWIPVVRAMGGGSGVSGVVAQVYVDWRPGRAVRRYAALGLEAGAVADDLLRAALRVVVNRLQHGHAVLDGGLGVATVPERAPMVVRYRHVPDLLQGGQAVRLNAELLEPDGRVVRRVSATPRGPDLQQLDFGRAPDAPGGVSDFNLRLRVIDALDATILDEVAWPLRVVSARGHVPPRRPVEAAGSLLADTGRPVYPLIQPWDEPSAPRRVLAPARYPAARVADWLDRSRELGLNAVSFTLDAPDLLPQYEHLAGELEGRRMFALVHLPVFPALHTDWAAARALVAQLARCRTDPVLAFDLAAPPPLAPADDPAWAAAWGAWLAEQFGSLAAAATALGCASPEAAAAAWRAPAPGEGAALALARRRCRADVRGRQLAAVRELLREYGLAHAVACAPAPGRPEADPAELAPLLDVLVVPVPPRAEAARPGTAAFLAAWSRGLSGGKPIWWREAGPAVPAEAGDAALADQARHWDDLFALMRRTSAAGGWLAGSPDGVPVFLRPDGRWRPAADIARAFSHQLRGLPPAQAGAWRGRTLDPWSEPAGLAGHRLHWAALYARDSAEEALVELRPSGFGVETRRLEARPLVAAGPCVPWRELNAQWIAVRVNGAPVWRAPGAALSVRRRDRVQLTVCNTGTATWVPWTGASSGARSVRVSVGVGAEEREMLRAPRLGLGQNGTVDWTPAEAGARQLRLGMPATGPWGEALRVDVLP